MEHTHQLSKAMAKIIYKYAQLNKVQVKLRKNRDKVRLLNEKFAKTDVFITNLNQGKDNLQKEIQALFKKLSGKPLLKVSQKMIWDQIVTLVSSHWKHFMISQDDIDLVIGAYKDA